METILDKTSALLLQEIRSREHESQKPSRALIKQLEEYFKACQVSTVSDREDACKAIIQDIVGDLSQEEMWTGIHKCFNVARKIYTWTV